MEEDFLAFLVLVVFSTSAFEEIGLFVFEEVLVRGLFFVEALVEESVFVFFLVVELEAEVELFAAFFETATDFFEFARAGVFVVVDFEVLTLDFLGLAVGMGSINLR